MLGFHGSSQRETVHMNNNLPTFLLFSLSLPKLFCFPYISRAYVFKTGALNRRTGDSHILRREMGEWMDRVTC